MRIGIVSDVHNNVEALTYALEALAGCELILSLGDLVSQYRAAPEIMRLARHARLEGILGNHEKTILSPVGAPVRNKLSPAELAFLGGLPHARELNLEGRTVAVWHGAPWDEAGDIHCEYIFESDAANMKRLAQTPADVVLIGHTHVAMLARDQDTLMLNPGSCGEGRDSARRLTFAELDFTAGLASIYEIRKGSNPEVLLTAEF
jgi:putative phosphoesterase